MKRRYFCSIGQPADTRTSQLSIGGQNSGKTSRMQKARIVSIVSALGLLAAVATGAAAATGGATTVAVQAGSTGLSISTLAPGTFGAVTLSGQDQVTHASLGAYTVTDATGTGAGWKVTFKASRFACAGGTGQCPSGGDTLDAGLLKVAPPTAACATGNGCLSRSAAPTGGISAETSIDGDSSAAAVTVLSAAAGAGMGKYTVTPGAFSSDTSKNLQLQLPAYAYAATYSSTLTIDIATGP
ncbi:MAG TPA: WxL domain-containing protein [Chloroflexota bacterium]|nr:WxL domain-containing protein [Chloroflexota bacterium]